MKLHPRLCHSLAALFMAGWLSITAFAQAARQTVSVPVPAAARLVPPQAQLAATQHLSVAITLPLRNRPALTNLLKQINDPRSPQFRHYLTREEFTEQFGPTVDDYNALKKFAIANGLHIGPEHANRMLLEVRGTAGEMERAFHTTLNVYRHPTEARTFYAPSVPPSLDLATPILSIGGLDNYTLAQPRMKATPLPHQSHALTPNAGSGPASTYRGGDFRAAYAPDTTLDGTGQVIGLLQFDGYNAEDIENYETQAGLPNVPLVNVLLNGATGSPSGMGGEIEVSLDIEMAISMAPGLSQIIVYMAPNPSPFESLLNQMASDNLAKQLSCSWYIPNGSARPAAEQIFLEMAAQGQTFFNASGDADAYTGLIDFPGDSPNITQVGGTTLSTTGPGGARVSESVWNRGDGVGSGGGISTQYSIPAWQTNIDMSVNQGSATLRNTPDVALTAQNIYVRASGTDYRVIGTSCAAPLWAGFMALVNQEAAASGRPPVGFLNATLDEIASSSRYNACFFDITTGDNTSPASPSAFFARPGYDLCTGWGCPAGQHLIDALANPEALRINPLTGFSSLGGAGGPFTVTSQDLTLTNAGTNSLTWTLFNPIPWLDATPTEGTLNAGDTATVAVTLNSAASNLTVGAYTGAIWFTNLASQAIFERDYSLSLIAPPSIIHQPTNQSVLDGATATFSVAVTGGPPLFYQWQLNGTNLADGGEFFGATTTNLAITNVSLAASGNYTLIVTNIAGSVTSTVAALNVIASAPVIVIPPANETAIAGKTAAFFVSAIGDKPFFYQWHYGGVGGTNIDGATNASLILPNVQLANAGLYSVTVSNPLGSTNSPDARLNVESVPIITGLDPDSAFHGANVTITGLNFDPTPGNNIVHFGPVQAAVLSASLTNLLVAVPSGATFSPITVTVNGLTAYSPRPFHPTFPGTGGLDSLSFASSVDVSAGTGPIRVAIADLNNDGKPDLVVAVAEEGVVSVYQNISLFGSLDTNSFGPRIDLPILLRQNDSPFGLAVADLDGDGKLDIIALDANNNSVSIFRNNNPGGTITTNSFDARIDLPAGTILRGVAIEDLNGDGRPEIVTANNGDDTISVFQNQSTPGNISFLNRVDFPCAPGPFTLAIADVDGDGHPDVVTANNGTDFGAVSVFENAGSFGPISSNSFLTRVDFSGNSAPEGLAVGDLDGDGKPDLITCSSFGGQVSVYRNLSSPGPLTTNSLDTVVDFGGGGTVNTVNVADLDGDGKLDIACTCQSPNMVSIFRNVSSPGSFTANSFQSRVDFSSGINPNGLAIGDLNGDGRPELVIDNFYSHTVSIYPNVSMIPGVPIVRDQPADITAYATSDATFTVNMSGYGPLFYQWIYNGTNLLSGATNATLALTNVQFSDEGDYSVVVTNALGLTISSNAFLLVIPPPGDIPVITGFNPRSANIGDTVTIVGANFSDVPANNIVYFGAVRAFVNSASKTNLVVTLPPGATHARVTVTVNGRTGMSDALFVPTFPGVGQIFTSSLTTRVDIATASGPVPTAIADLDGDGKPDVLVGDVTAGIISIFRNISTNGSLSPGSFAPRFDLSMGTVGNSNPYSIIVADLDGDGKLDIVAINADSKLISIFRNISVSGVITNGSFDTRMDLPGGNDMRGIAVGDVDGDGMLDIASADTSDNTVSVFRNKSQPGNISFAPRVSYPTAAGTFNVAIADIDGDGKRDLITVNNGAGGVGTISLLQNNSTVGVITDDSFLPHIDLPGANSAESLAIGDLDGDGKVDLVVGSPEGHAIFVYRNTSTLGVIDTTAFASEVTFGTSSVVNTVALADLDGDGKIDIAAVTQNPGSLVVFKNVSTPGVLDATSLQPQVPFAAGGNAIGISLGDLDGDGKTDVIFNSYYENLLSIYRNVTTNGQPPQIITPPTNAIACIGSDTNFNVTVSGTSPLQFQWYFNETNLLIGATNSVLPLANVQSSNAGLYSVSLSNRFGFVLSSNATLTVTGLHHFAWSPIPSPRFLNTPFPVTIMAQDVTNATFTNFTGTVLLSSVSGVPITPSVSGNFVAGTWTGNITVCQTTTGLVLKASDTAGRVGLANAIDMVAPPTLSLLNFNTSLLASWPTSPSGFVLESSSNLQSGNWTTVPGNPISFNGQNLQSISLPATNQFFRLRFPGP